MLLDDPAFVIRGDPALLDHDRRGFRNADTLDAARVLALGDSQTYGLNVRRAEAWPARLARELGAPVYSAAVGGWGVAQYAAAAHDLLELQSFAARDVVIGLYLGNDIHEGWRHGTRMRHPLIERWMREEWRTLEPPDVRCRRERREAVAAAGSYPEAARRGAVDCYPVEVEAGGRRARYLTEPVLRARVLDPKHPTTRAGLEVAEHAIAYIGDTVYGLGGSLLLALIPTRERLIAERPREEVRASDEVLWLLETLRKREVAITGELARMAGARSIRVLDLGGPLGAFLAHGLYQPETPDGHPNARGHALIAKVIARELREAKPGVSVEVYPMA